MTEIGSCKAYLAGCAPHVVRFEIILPPLQQILEPVSISSRDNLFWPEHGQIILLV
jgi:hypothetical protein